MAAEVAVLTPESINSTTQDHFSESPIDPHPPLPIQSVVEDEQEELTQDNIVKTEEEEAGLFKSEDITHSSMENTNTNQIEGELEPTNQAIQEQEENTNVKRENNSNDTSEVKQEQSDVLLPPPPPLEEFEQAQESYPTPPPANIPITQSSATRIQRDVVPMSLKSRTNSSKNSRKNRSINNMGGNVQMFECSDCDKAYASESRLRRHKLYHLDISERPFQCEFCIWSFVQQSELKRHLKRKHPSKQITQPIVPRYRIGDTHDPNLPPSLRLDNLTRSTSNISTSSTSIIISNNHNKSILTSNLHRMPHNNMANMPTLSDPLSIPSAIPSSAIPSAIPPSIDTSESMHHNNTDPGDTTTTTTVDEENTNDNPAQIVETKDEINIKDEVVEQVNNINNSEPLPVPPSNPELMKVDETEQNKDNNSNDNGGNNNNRKRKSRKRKREEIVEENNDNGNKEEKEEEEEEEENENKRKSKRSNKRQKYDKFFVEFDDYRCRFCGNLFHTKQSLTDHERIHTAAKPYTCKYCMKGFTKKEEWQQHESSHTFLD